MKRGFVIDTRGIFFSGDALLAVLIILFVLATIFPVQEETRYETQVHYDILETLSVLRVGEVNNSYVDALIISGQIQNLNKSLLEQIGEFYVTNITLARELATAVLSEVNVTDNVGLWYGSTMIYSRNSTSFEDAKDIDTARAILSGINGGTSVTGFSARAFLSSSLLHEYYYFGGYIGDGNISILAPYPGNITDAAIELAINNDFELFVNNISTGIFAGSVNEFTPVNYTINISNFNSGINVVEFRGSNLHIAGGFLRITYQTDVAYSQPYRYRFPGIKGLVNLYDGFYVPGNLTYLDVVLHLNSSVNPAFLNIGNVTVFNGTTNDEETITISDSNLSAVLNYSALSEKTVPLRLGLENLSFLGIAQEIDLFSVTDLSGSMEENCPGGQADPGETPCKINDAKNATSVLIDVILNSSGNRVGLAGYKALAREEDFHDLSADDTSLKNEVDSWDAGGATCICCGINRAVQGFLQGSGLMSTNTGILLAYYNFDNNVNDQSGNGNSGTIQGNPTWTGGISGNSLDFDGSGDSVRIPDIINSTEGTISVWMQPDSLSGQTLFDASTPSSGSAKYFFVDINSSQDLRFWLEDNSDADFQGASYGVSSLNVDQWYHVAAVWRYNGASPSTELYLNGTLVAQDSNSAGVIPNFLDPSIGDSRSNYITLWDFDGAIDEVRVYSKALTPQEIKGLAEQNTVCGNGITEVGEVCDGTMQYCSIGGNEGVQACNAGCSGYGACDIFGGNCGDGIINSGEGCDDGNTADSDGCSSTCIPENRFWSMIVMSDGQANRECSQQNTGDAVDDAIQAACDSWNDYGISVHAIGFGAGADEATLQQIAQCGNGSYFFSDVNEIVEIYQQVAQLIISSYVEQTLISSNLYTRLYDDSYIQFEYVSPSIPTGLILRLQSPFTNTFSGSFSVPNDVVVLETTVNSYSGSRWTDHVAIDGASVYRLSDYGNNYIFYGDPYTINIPNSFMVPGSTYSVNVTTGVAPGNSSAGSQYNKVTLTMLKNASSFSPIVATANGCFWSIEFENGNVASGGIPPFYAGGDLCAYNSTFDGVDTNDGFIPNENDAVQIAVRDLLREFDLDSDGVVDFLFGEQDLEVSFDEIVGIPFTWSSEVHVRRWY